MADAGGSISPSGLLTKICTVVVILLCTTAAHAARLVVDIRFETYDQSLWATGGTAELPGYISGDDLTIDNGDIATIVGLDLANLDLYVVEAGLNFRAGLDVGLSGDAGRADAALDYQVGLEFNYSELSANNIGNFVRMQVVGRHDASVLRTEFPQIQLHADLVFDVDAQIDGTEVFAFDLADPLPAPLNGVTNPGRLLGLNADGDGTIEVLPLVQEIFAIGRDVGRITPGVSLDLEVREESDEEKRKRTESGGLEPGQQTDNDDSKKKAKAKLSLQLPSPINTGRLFEVDVRLPQIETLGLGHGALQTLETDGHDDFLDVTFDIDNFLTAIRILPVPLQAEVDIFVASVSVNVLDVDLIGGIGINQHFALTPIAPAHTVSFNQDVTLRTSGGEVNVSANDPWIVQDGMFDLKWTSSLQAAASNGTLSITVDTVAGAELFNQTDLTGNLALNIEAFSGSVSGFGVDESIGPLIQAPPISIVSGDLANLFTDEFPLARIIHEFGRSTAFTLKRRREASDIV